LAYRSGQSPCSPEKKKAIANRDETLPATIIIRRWPFATVTHKRQLPHCRRTQQQQQQQQMQKSKDRAGIA